MLPCNLMVEFDRRILQKIQKDRSIGTMLEKNVRKDRTSSSVSIF